MCAALVGTEAAASRQGGREQRAGNARRRGGAAAAYRTDSELRELSHAGRVPDSMLMPKLMKFRLERLAHEGGSVPVSEQLRMRLRCRETRPRMREHHQH